MSIFLCLLSKPVMTHAHCTRTHKNTHARTHTHLSNRSYWDSKSLINSGFLSLVYFTALSRGNPTEKKAIKQSHIGQSSIGSFSITDSENTTISILGCCNLSNMDFIGWESTCKIFSWQVYVYWVVYDHWTGLVGWTRMLHIFYRKKYLGNWLLHWMKNIQLEQSTLPCVFIFKGCTQLPA